MSGRLPPGWELLVAPLAQSEAGVLGRVPSTRPVDSAVDDAAGAPPATTPGGTPG